MGTYLSDDGTAGCDLFVRAKRSKVLLREPERCPECGEEYLSLYPLGKCAEHDPTDRV